MEKKIKLGKYQMKNSASAFIASSLEGIEIVLSSIIFPSIMRQWNLNANMKVIFLQAIFGGQMIGNLIGGYLGDKLGRKATTNIGILICLVFGYISAFAPCFTSFIIWRCITMSGVGLIQSNVSTILGEMFTQEYKNSVQIFRYLAQSSGSLIVSFFAIYILNDKDEDSWRYLTATVNIMAFFSLLAGYFQKESIKFQLDNKQFEKAFENINYAIEQNDKDNKTLNEYEKEQLTAHFTNNAEKNKAKSDGYKEIFIPRFRRNTIFVAVQYFSITLLNYAIIFLIPLRLSSLSYKFNISQQQNLILVSSIIEITQILLLLIFVYKNYLKVQYFFRLFYIFFVLLILIQSFQINQEVVTLLLSRGCLGGLTSLKYIITDIVFPSYIKSRSYGFNNFIARVGVILMPIIIFKIFNGKYNELMIYMIIHGIIFGLFELFIQYFDDPDQVSNSQFVYSEFKDDQYQFQQNELRKQASKQQSQQYSYQSYINKDQKLNIELQKQLHVQSDKKEQKQNNDE